MAYTGRFDGVDGEKAKITDQRGAWWAFIGRGVDVSNIAVGATVEFEVQEVPPKDPSKRPYKRFSRITPVGQGAPPSMRPVAAAAPRVAAPAAAAPGYSPPNDDMRNEYIFVAGIVNNFVGQTGDTSVAGLTKAALNAREAFQVVFRGKKPSSAGAPSEQPVDDWADRDAQF